MCSAGRMPTRTDRPEVHVPDATKPALVETVPPSTSRNPMRLRISSNPSVLSMCIFCYLSLFIVRLLVIVFLSPFQPSLCSGLDKEPLSVRCCRAYLASLVRSQLAVHAALYKRFIVCRDQPFLRYCADGADVLQRPRAAALSCALFRSEGAHRHRDAGPFERAPFAARAGPGE
jgi:hypothetical protein